MRKTSVNDDVMTTREVGETLGVAVRTVQLWVEAGVLPAWRTAGGHRRIARSAVDKLLSERKQNLAATGVTAPDTNPSLPKILLVEDDANMRRLFRGVVAVWKFPVELTTADNGFEGLLRIGEIEPDVVITDLVMPGMDGFAMLRALSSQESRRAERQVIVVSSLDDDDIAQRGGLPAGVAYFQKPVHYGRLEALVGKFLATKFARLAALQ
jgi:excisionase family DNA binding protein